jgi:hypothetical protein
MNESEEINPNNTDEFLNSVDEKRYIAYNRWLDNTYSILDGEGLTQEQFDQILVKDTDNLARRLFNMWEAKFTSAAAAQVLVDDWKTKGIWPDISISSMVLGVAKRIAFRCINVK